MNCSDKAVFYAENDAQIRKACSLISLKENSFYKTNLIAESLLIHLTVFILKLYCVQYRL